MKKFTQKFFLLSMGLMLSMGAYAQDEGTPVVYHRFPEVQFTYTSGGTTRELTMPAWDVQFASSGQGYVRVQRINKTGDGQYTARIVTRQPLYNNGGSAEYRLTSTDAEIEYKGQKYALKDFTYDKIIPDGYESMMAYHAALGGSNNEHWGTLSEDVLKTFPVVHNVAIDALFVKTYPNSQLNNGVVTGNYTIPTKIENATIGTHSIIEIGPFAYRNPSWDEPSKGWFKPSSITIPKEIKKIGRDGLSVNISNGANATSEPYTKKITFEAGSTITEIPVEAFMSCVGLQEINIPASVTSIGYGALGGCKSLKKIVFEGANPPSLGVSDGGKYDFVTSSGSTRNIGQTAAGVAADHAKCIMEVPLGSALSYTQKDDLYKKFPMMSKFTLKKDIISYCSDLPFTFKQYNTSNKTWSDGSVKVYYVDPDDVNVKDGWIEFTEITDTKKIPTEYAGNNETGYFGVLLKGTAGETYNIFYPNNVLTAVVSAENCLEGVITDYDIEINSFYLYYVLSNGRFLPVKQDGTLAANKAFIMIEVPEGMNTGNARELKMSFPGETDGITTHDVQGLQNDAFYTLQGIQVKNPEKGVFIKNGKKYIIK